MKNKYIKSTILLAGFGLLPALVFAQTGPGGVSSIGTNTNLKLWLRADMQTYTNAGTTQATNGQSVQQWNDLSGNGAAAINTGTNKPTLATGAINGLPALNFNGTNQTTTAAVDIRPSVMADITVIAVAKTNVSTGSMGKIWGHDAPTQTTGFQRAIGMDSRVTNTLGYFAGTGVYNYGNVTANSYFISTANYTSTGFSGYLDGSLTASGSVTCTGGLTSISIGSITPSSEFWNGSIAEFIIFNKTLSQAERQMVENYLSAKYGLTLAGGDFYTMDNPANGNYDFEVAGMISGPSGTSVTNSQGTGIVTLSNPSTIGTNQSFMFGHDNGTLTLTGANRPSAGLTSRLARTWRPSEFGDVGTMNLAFDVSGITGAPANQNDYFLLIDRDNDGSFIDESVATGGVIAATSKAGSTVTFNAVNIANAQRFTLGFGNTVALPLDLLSFGAAAEGPQNRISWETANSKGVAAIELERSTDGKTFSLLQHAAVREDGRYEAIDAAPATISYYRLRILDQDGSSSYGSIAKVTRQERAAAITLSPNPATDIVHVNGLPGSPAVIRIFDCSGRQVYSGRTAAASEAIEVGSLPAGSYFMTIDADGLHTTQRVSRL